MAEENELEKNKKFWKNQGKKPDEITYGMICDGFRSLSGIPDDFYSAEDPLDRVKLWNKHNNPTLADIIYRRLCNGPGINEPCRRCGRVGCGCD